MGALISVHLMHIMILMHRFIWVFRVVGGLSFFYPREKSEW